MKNNRLVLSIALVIVWVAGIILMGSKLWLSAGAKMWQINFLVRTPIIYLLFAVTLA